MKSNKTGYRGVFRKSGRNAWVAHGVVNKKTVHIGTYRTAEQAALMYDAWVRLNRPEGSFLNFPERQETLVTCFSKNTRMCYYQWIMGPVKRSRSGFRGVRHKPKGSPSYPWVPIVSQHDKKLSLGRYATAEEAAHVYDNWVREHGPCNAYLNFPDDTAHIAMRLSDPISVRNRYWLQGPKPNCVSGYKGVSYDKNPTVRSCPWKARCKNDEGTTLASYHRTAEVAARVYDQWVRQFGPEGAYLNFPDES